MDGDSRGGESRRGPRRVADRCSDESPMGVGGRGRVGEVSGKRRRTAVAARELRRREGRRRGGAADGMRVPRGAYKGVPRFFRQPPPQRVSRRNSDKKSGAPPAPVDWVPVFGSAVPKSRNPSATRVRELDPALAFRYQYRRGSHLTVSPMRPSARPPSFGGREGSRPSWVNPTPGRASRGGEIGLSPTLPDSMSRPLKFAIKGARVLPAPTALFFGQNHCEFAFTFSRSVFAPSRDAATS